MRSEKKSKVPGTNENELTTIQNLRGTAKAVLGGKFIMIQAYLKRIETAQITNLIIHLQELEEQHKDNPEQVEERVSDKQYSSPKVMRCEAMWQNKYSKSIKTIP